MMSSATTATVRNVCCQRHSLVCKWGLPLDSEWKWHVHECLLLLGVCLESLYAESESATASNKNTVDCVPHLVFTSRGSCLMKVIYFLLVLTCGSSWSPVNPGAWWKVPFY